MIIKEEKEDVVIVERSTNKRNAPKLEDVIEIEDDDDNESGENNNNSKEDKQKGVAFLTPTI